MASSAIATPSRWDHRKPSLNPHAQSRADFKSLKAFTFRNLQTSEPTNLSNHCKCSIKQSEKPRGKRTQHCWPNFVGSCCVRLHVAKTFDRFQTLRNNSQQHATKVAQEEQGWLVQWWEHRPPTNAPRVQIPASPPYVGWGSYWFSPLLQEVLLRILRCSPLLKNQHFQIPIRSGTHGHVQTSS